MRPAPDQVLVRPGRPHQRVQPRGLEEAADQVERRIREKFPEVQHVFLYRHPGAKPERSPTGPEVSRVGEDAPDAPEMWTGDCPMMRDHGPESPAPH